MSISLTTRFAIRTLGRSKRRSLLSVIGVGVGCAVALFLTAFMNGANEMRVQSIADSGFGHLRIAPGGWNKTRENDLRLHDWQEALNVTNAMEGVRVAAPHARATALLAFGTRVSGVELLGVDPPAEAALSRLVRAVSEGRYLKTGDSGATVIGSTIAERLDVALDDDLLLTVVGKGGQMEYAMLRIVGIAHTGSRDLDASICHVTLEDIERLTGLNGAGEITVTLHDLGDLDRATSQLRTVIPEGDDVLTWKEVQPAQGADSESDKAFTNLFVGIVAIVVIFGITGAQLTAILDRRREFAVLIALGMKGRQVTRLVLTEAAVLGILGAAAGLLLAMPLVYYTATTGIDFGAMMGGETSISGILFDPVMYSDMGLWMIPHALFVALASTLIATLYPAYYAVRTNPTSALSLREA